MSLSGNNALAAPGDPVSLLQGLIRCRSVTPAEGGALAFLEARLATAGFAVERPVFSAEGTPAIENLFATIGSGSPHFVFAGHTDVVPAGAEAQWRHPPFEGVIDQEVMYGRGAVDMKGGIAAFLAAALAFVGEGGPKGTLSLLITGDEEGPAVNGTIKLLEWATAKGHVFDACIVGEPTNPEALGDAIKVGRRGSLSGTVTVTGRQGHVAYPHLADNPVPALLKLAAALTPSRLDDGTQRFQPSNLEIVSVDVGNPAFNVIPGMASARFNVRFNELWSADSLKAMIAARLDAAADGRPYALTFEPALSDVFLTRAEPLIAVLSETIRAVTGRTPELSTSGGTSDARFIKNYCPVLEFGLVGQTMHQVDERVPLADLHALTEIYRRFLVRYFGA
jgi:succinyl-diaminopimelate desuccinylase